MNYLKKNQTNVIISCCYRVPQSDINIFLLGDFNINLLAALIVVKYSKIHYTLGFHPLIIRPTRITPNSATLIDNFFTSYLTDNFRSGLMVDDVSDHLSVFTICDINNLPNRKQTKYTYKRKLDVQSLDLLNNELENIGWNSVTKCKTVEAAYDNFIKLFGMKVNKICPCTNQS